MSADDDIQVLAGEYVLGVLDPAEARAVERRLIDDAALKAAVAGWRTRFGEIDAAAPAEAPSPQLWSAIEQALAKPTPAPAPILFASRAPLSGRLWNSLGFWRSLGLAAAAASVVLTVGLGAQMLRQPPSPVLIAVLEADDSAPGAIVEAYADGSIKLVPLTDIPVPPGRALQVWTLWDQARGPVPMGLLDRAQRVTLSGDGQPKPRPQQLYEITLEPASGSPTGRPTGPILYKGLGAVPR